MDGEIVIMNLSNSKYFSLKGVGTAIWKLIEHPKTKQEIVTAIATDFNVSEADCTGDIDAFVTALKAADLLQEA